MRAVYLMIFTLLLAPIVQAQLYYAVIWLAPVPDSIYYRGDKLDIRIKLFEAGRPVSGAKVTATLPVGVIQLEETESGIYEAQYVISWDAPTGDWNIQIMAEKKVDNETYQGKGEIKIFVKPTNFVVRVISPGPRVEQARINIKVNVTYPDGSAVTGGLVTATLDDKEINLRDSGAGIYTISSKVPEGRLELHIRASDAYNNSGSASRIVYVEIKRIGILERALEHWPALALGIGLFFSASLLLFAHHSKQVWLKNLLREKDRILELKREAQRGYFHEKTMDRASYEKLMQEYDAAEEKINEKIERVKKMRLRGWLYEKLKKK